MKKILATTTILLSTTSFPLIAAPMQVDFTATILDVSGTFDTDMSTGTSISGSYIYDTDEANASNAETTPSNVPGHEFSSFYDFAGAPYAASLSSASYSFNNTAPVSIVVNDGLFLTSEEIGGILPDGHYDWIEILGSTTQDVGGASHTPGNGQEWTLAIFAPDDSWFSDGSLVPDTLPAGYSTLLVGFDFDSNGDEIGFAFASIDSISFTAVPVPAAAWLFLSGLLGLAAVGRRS